VVTREEAAAARATAARKSEATKRLSALEVERRGYVVRGQDERVEQVDEEIARYRDLAGVTAPEDEQDAAGDPQGDASGSGDASGEEPAEKPRRGRAKASAAPAGDEPAED
jgi:hypothetical protein